MNGCKKIDELTFADLYVEIPDQSFPCLREAFHRWGGKLHKTNEDLILTVLFLLRNKLTPPRLKI